MFVKIKTMKTLKIVLWIFFGIFIPFSVFTVIEPSAIGWLDNNNLFDFITDAVGILSLILVMISIVNQNIENLKSQAESHFFKMLDYHSENVKSLTVKHIKNEYDEIVTGRRGFVIFRLQLIKLVEVVEKINSELKLNLKKSKIIDIAYISFYYGINEDWKDFLMNKLKRYDKSEEIVKKLIYYKNKINEEKKINIGRTNQTSLSVYFRNMYNAVKFIDKNNILNKEEKEKYIKIFRAQLSNPELYIIFLNVVSRFGKKWKDNNFIEKYEFLKNIPFDYCGNFSPKEFFNIRYEEEEIN